MNIFTALSPIYVEQPRYIGSSLYKNPLTCCKNKRETSTRPREPLLSSFGKSISAGNSLGQHVLVKAEFNRLITA